jgi:hypothetical protein
MKEESPAGRPVVRIPRSEALLDAAVENTFPASDPISIDHAFGTALRREKRDADAVGVSPSWCDARAEAPERKKQIATRRAGY